MYAELAVASAQRIGGAALAGFGWQIGRDAYRNLGNIVTFGFLCLVGAGGFVLPLMAGRRITQWHPGGAVHYLFRVVLLWAVLCVLGFGLLWVTLDVLAIIGTRMNKPMWEVNAIATKLTWIVGPAVVLIGALWGLTERGKRRRTLAVLVCNQAFLDAHGIREVDGASFTHVDGQGTRLKLERAGRDIIEFEAVGARGKRAYIPITPEGRFEDYSGLVEA